MKIVKENDIQFAIKHDNAAAVVISLLFMLFGIAALCRIEFLNQVPWWVGIIFIASGIPGILLPARELTIFDKSKNTLFVSRKSFVKKEKFEYSLKDIKEVDLWIVANTSGNRGWQYLLGCKLNNNERIILNESHPASSTQVYGAGMSYGFIPERKIGERLSNFLKVPFFEIQPPTFTEAVSSTADKMKEVVEEYSKEHDKSGSN